MNKKIKISLASLAIATPVTTVALTSVSCATSSTKEHNGNNISDDRSENFKKGFNTAYTIDKESNKKVYTNASLNKAIKDQVTAYQPSANLYDYDIVDQIIYDNKDIKSSTTETATFSGHAGKLSDGLNPSAVPFSVSVVYNWITKKYTTNDFKTIGKSYSDVLSLANKDMNKAISWSFNTNKAESVIFTNITANAKINTTNVFKPTIKINGMVNIKGQRQLFNEVVAYNYNNKLDQGYYQTSDLSFANVTTPFSVVNDQFIKNAIINGSTTPDLAITKIISLNKTSDNNGVNFNNKDAQGSELYNGIALFTNDKTDNLEYYFSVKVNYDYSNKTYTVENIAKNEPYFASYLTMNNLLKETQITTLTATLASLTPNKTTFKFHIVENSLNTKDYLNPTVKIQGHVESTDNKRQTNFIETVTYSAKTGNYTFVNYNNSFETYNAFDLTELSSPITRYLFQQKFAPTQTPLTATFTVTANTIEYNFNKNTTKATIVVSLPVLGKTTLSINLNVVYNYDTQSYTINTITV